MKAVRTRTRLEKTRARISACETKLELLRESVTADEATLATLKRYAPFLDMSDTFAEQERVVTPEPPRLTLQQLKLPDLVRAIMRKTTGMVRPSYIIAAVQRVRPDETPANVYSAIHRLKGKGMESSGAGRGTVYRWVNDEKNLDGGAKKGT